MYAVSFLTLLTAGTPIELSNLQYYVVTASNIGSSVTTQFSLAVQIDPLLPGIYYFLPRCSNGGVAVDV